MNRIMFINCKKLVNFSVKKYSNLANCIYKEEFSVSPFINLNVKCPFNVQIRPLDVHAFPNCDKLTIKLYSTSSEIDFKIFNEQNQKNFSFTSETNTPHYINCLIETPIKSDIDVTSYAGNIDIKKLNGEKIILHTDLGNIVSHNCQNSKINFSTNGGNITTLGTLHAGEIELIAKKLGTINANHLQSLKSNIVTENGDIKVNSSYCDDTVFKTRKGKLYLDSVHKNCSIEILENGFLQMTGFDGTLNAKIGEGDVDIQLSKLYDTSKIIANKKGNILLRISEWMQENIEIEATCQQIKVSDNVKLRMKNKDTFTILKTQNSEQTSKLVINANLCNLNIEGASWSDMLKLKGIKFVE